jgi:hypothetical protein
MVKIRNAFRILVGKPEGKRPFGRPTCRWEVKIEVHCVDVWIEFI